MEEVWAKEMMGLRIVHHPQVLHQQAFHLAMVAVVAVVAVLLMLRVQQFVIDTTFDVAPIWRFDHGDYLMTKYPMRIGYDAQERPCQDQAVDQHRFQCLEKDSVWMDEWMLLVMGMEKR